MTTYSDYRGKAVTQHDGSSLANANCRMASIATGLDFETVGGTTSTAKRMRSYTDDQSGGTDSSDAVQSWSRGYGKSLRVRDGATFTDALADLQAGRMVHLDVWHASVGGPCLSGSGTYGHTMAVAPDKNADGWAVADPWCNPGAWHRVTEAKLRAGAEEWGRRVYSSATAGRADWHDLSRADQLVLLRLAAKALMTQYHPGNPAPMDWMPHGADTGGGSILYTTTKANPKGSAAAEDPTMDHRYANPANGTVVIGSGRGIVNLVTGKTVTPSSTSFQAYARVVLAEPIDDSGEGESRQKGYAVNYKDQSHLVLDDTVQSFTAVEPAPIEPPDTAEAIEQRDEEWLSWLTDGAPSTVAPSGTPLTAPPDLLTVVVALALLGLLAIIVLLAIITTQLGA